jgi:multidrug efflux system membrane fusion protein
MMRNVVVVLVLVIGLAVAGWFWLGNSAPATQQAAPSGPPAVPVTADVARKQDVPIYRLGLGAVQAYNTVTVHVRVDGELDKVAFTEGQEVKAGDLLAQIDPRPFQAALDQVVATKAKDEAQLANAERDLDRYVTLAPQNFTSKQVLDTQRALVAQLAAQIKADQASIDSAKLQITYSHITAPISGRVGLRLVDVGNIVHATDTNGLLVITQLQPIAVIFSLPQDQLSQVLSKLQGKQLPVEAYDRDDSTKIATGKLLTIDNQIDTTTGTYKLKAQFDNDKSILFPNQFVNIHLLVDTKHNVTIVPTTAIQRGPQGTYVYLAENDSTVKIRPVSVALSSGNSVGITNGVQPGDNVVVDGQDKLQDGSKIEAHNTVAGPANSQGQPSQDTDPSPAPNQPSRENPASSSAHKGTPQ